MSPFRVIVVLMLLAFAAGSRSAWPTAAGASPVYPIQIEQIQPIGPLGDRSMGPWTDSAAGTQPQTDLFGNEVDEAVGDYRVDTRGDIYERHSPETEVPRLGPAIL